MKKKKKKTDTLSYHLSLLQDHLKLDGWSSDNDGHNVFFFLHLRNTAKVNMNLNRFGICWCGPYSSVGDKMNEDKDKWDIEGSSMSWSLRI